ncbi:serine/threonine-protein kinase [Methylovirgula sp. 4M-Z18]|uniref:serine/threonine-protein kinase n=1 Tax=Methylovirgula sp. 4M-Z18 TaxID=2293567 RepID=UPI000E2E9747|nr:serine/threonine-protein kinase [Methylovirgula sp. 4M-Z18]RFB80718.1 serine/threonine protein kinase [Methylovirgula sp. 4M-Z18]
MSALTCTHVNAKGVVCSGIIEDGVCGTCGRPATAGSLLAGVSATTSTAAKATAAFTSSTATHGTGKTSRRQTKGTTSRRQSLGGGLVSMPIMPSQDPMKLVMATPEVSLGKRRCPHCNTRVNRMKGFCPQCSEAYDFTPKLTSGDVIAGKYEIKGPIAFGGMGWVYLGWDNVLSRWVVLKGLLNTQDAEAAAAAVAERQFLAAVKHGRIVGIYDFVTHGAEGFMVLEYVGGRTLESIRDERGPLPVEEAISYILGILPAFGYLHTQGLVYCDFKPGNLMVENDDVKLVDMGAVRRIDDPDGAVFGTDGYSAKDAADNPTVSSDLYTIGRTLAVLCMDFLYKIVQETDATTGKVTTSRRMLSAYMNALPEQSSQPVLAQNNSFYRFLLRAIHDDPDMRFQSADEMEGQLFGVLREIVAVKSEPKPADSKVFFGDGLIDGADREGAAKPLARILPQLKMDAADPAASELLNLAAVIDPQRRLDALRNLRRKMPASAEVMLRTADTHISTGANEAALTVLADLLKQNEFEWRAYWYRGKALLQAGKAPEAKAAFDRVYFEMPGELAPKLALGFAAEAAGDVAEAQHFYQRVVQVDPGLAAACFGLARILKASKESASAARALEAVPSSHSMYVASRLALANVLIHAEQTPAQGFLERAGATLEALPKEGAIVHQLSARLISKAIDQIRSGQVPERRDAKLLGYPITLNALRQGAEKEYWHSARLATSAGEKAMWVDLAHKVRPITLF